RMRARARPTRDLLAPPAAQEEVTASAHEVAPRAAFRRRPLRASTVHDHREKGVIAVDADQVDDALLAEAQNRRSPGVVADATIAMQLGREVEHQRFVLRHARRPPPFGYRLYG